MIPHPGLCCLCYKEADAPRFQIWDGDKGRLKICSDSCLRLFNSIIEKMKKAPDPKVDLKRPRSAGFRLVTENNIGKNEKTSL